MNYIIYLDVSLHFQTNQSFVCGRRGLLMNFFFCSSQEILEMTEDYVIDIPQVCDYLGEIFGKFLNISTCIASEFSRFLLS